MASSSALVVVAASNSDKKKKKKKKKKQQQQQQLPANNDRVDNQFPLWLSEREDFQQHFVKNPDLVQIEAAMRAGGKCKIFDDARRIGRLVWQILFGSLVELSTDHLAELGSSLSLTELAAGKALPLELRVALEEVSSTRALATLSDTILIVDGGLVAKDERFDPGSVLPRALVNTAVAGHQGATVVSVPTAVVCKLTQLQLSNDRARVVTLLTKKCKLCAGMTPRKIEALARRGAYLILARKHRAKKRHNVLLTRVGDLLIEEDCSPFERSLDEPRKDPIDALSTLRDLNDLSPRLTTTELQKTTNRAQVWILLRGSVVLSKTVHSRARNRWPKGEGYDGVRVTQTKELLLKTCEAGEMFGEEGLVAEDESSCRRAYTASAYIPDGDDAEDYHGTVELLRVSVSEVLRLMPQEALKDHLEVVKAELYQDKIARLKLRHDRSAGQLKQLSALLKDCRGEQYARRLARSRSLPELQSVGHGRVKLLSPRAEACSLKNNNNKKVHFKGTILNSASSSSLVNNRRRPGLGPRSMAQGSTLELLPRLHN